MKEAICKRCGAIFETNGGMPDFECTCQSKEFILIN